MNKKSKIKIFVSHRIDKNCDSFDNPLFVNVRCGATFDKRKNTTMLGDNTGENISELRNEFCEFTVQYWAWKNQDADYYGLFHYRRYLNFKKYNYHEDSYGHIIEEYIDDNSAKYYGFDEETMRNTIENYDIILPKKGDVSSFPEHYASVWKQWCGVKDLHEEDLETLLSVISKSQPDYYKTAKKYLKGKYAYFCAMFIMKKEFFISYCNWLYPILFQLKDEIDISYYTEEGQRTVGHLAERLLGIYVSYLKKKDPKVRIKELQTVLFTKPEKQRLIEPVFNMSSTIPIVFSSSNVFAPICATALKSIIVNSNPNKKYDIIILESDISEKNKELIKNLTDKENISIRFYNVLKIISQFNLLGNGHVTIETYYRFLIQAIMPEYSKVIYLDSDLVCNKDISELYDIDVSNFYLAAAHDPDMIGMLDLPQSDILRYLQTKVHLSDPYQYFQGGVLLLNIEKMKKAYSIEEWLSFAQKNYTFFDQDILNRYCQNKVKFINMSWNVLIDCNNYRVPVTIKNAIASIYEEYTTARKSPYIIHFAGFEKPWKQKGVDFEEEFWKYARMTPYYESLLFDVLKTLEDNINNCPPKDIGLKTAFRNYIKKKFIMLCPLGTRRYKIISKIFHLFFK